MQSISSERKSRKSSKLSQKLDNLQYIDNDEDNEYGNLNDNDNDIIHNTDNDDDDYGGLNFKQSPSTSNEENEESQLGASDAFKVKNKKINCNFHKKINFILLFSYKK